MLAALMAFGRRNLAYLLFTALLFPLAIWLESTGKSQGPDRGAGYMVGIALWGLASLAAVAVNVILLIIGLSNKRPVIKELIAIALPFGVVALVLGLDGVGL
jgi:hypothetical protein